MIFALVSAMGVLVGLLYGTTRTQNFATAADLARLDSRRAQIETRLDRLDARVESKPSADAHRPPHLAR